MILSAETNIVNNALQCIIIENGAPSDWAGIMLVSVIFINGEVNSYLKVAWDMSMTQYIMKNNKDGSVAQAWTKL